MEGLEQLESVLEESGDRQNPQAEEMKEIFETVRSIAVVGISRNPEKAARRVPAYLASKGYEIIPINPFVDEVLGKKAWDSLDEVTDPIDMVLVFRPSEEAALVARAAMNRKERPVIWLQEEIRADAIAAEAREQGIRVVQDLCAYKVHKALPAR